MSATILDGNDVMSVRETRLATDLARGQALLTAALIPDSHDVKVSRWDLRPGERDRCFDRIAPLSGDHPLGSHHPVGLLLKDIKQAREGLLKRGRLPLAPTHLILSPPESFHQLLAHSE